MSTSAYPTLDLLGQYGLRQAYLILILGARSSTHLQQLHDKGIQLDCQLPRNLFIELKHERKRMLEIGGEEEGLIRQGPSDVVLLQEFNAARRSMLDRRPGSLLKYYLQLLSDHNGLRDDGLRRYVQDGNTGNYGLFVQLSDGELDNLRSCKVNGVEYEVLISVHHQSVQASPPDGVTLPKDYTLAKVEKMLRFRLRVKYSQIHHLITQSLLELPQWDGFSDLEPCVTIYYQFQFPDAIPLATPNENGEIMVDKATMVALIAFLTEHGIPLEVDLSQVL